MNKTNNLVKKMNEDDQYYPEISELLRKIKEALGFAVDATEVYKKHLEGKGIESLDNPKDVAIQVDIHNMADFINSVV